MGSAGYSTRKLVARYQGAFASQSLSLGGCCRTSLLLWIWPVQRSHSLCRTSLCSKSRLCRHNTRTDFGVCRIYEWPSKWSSAFCNCDLLDVVNLGNRRLARSGSIHDSKFLAEVMLSDFGLWSWRCRRRISLNACARSTYKNRWIY